METSDIDAGMSLDEMEEALRLLPMEKQLEYRRALVVARREELRSAIWSTPQTFIFSGYVYTNDPHHNPAKRVFPDKEYLRELIDAFDREQMLFVEKSRQMMATNAAMAYAYWYAAAQPGRQVYVRSERRDQAVDILGRCRFIHRNLPDWLQPPIKEDDLDKQDRSKLQFQNDSFIQALSAGPHKIRSTTASLIVDDEVAFWQNYSESLAAALPSVEGGGKLLTLTTAYPGDASELCHDRC